MTEKETSLTTHVREAHDGAQPVSCCALAVAEREDALAHSLETAQQNFRSLENMIRDLQAENRQLAYAGEASHTRLAGMLGLPSSSTANELFEALRIRMQRSEEICMMIYTFVETNASMPPGLQSLPTTARTWYDLYGHRTA